MSVVVWSVSPCCGGVLVGFRVFGVVWSVFGDGGMFVAFVRNSKVLVRNFVFLWRRSFGVGRWSG